ncbi:putative nuclease HARBI1, partial [Aphis craccivora]
MNDIFGLIEFIQFATDEEEVPIRKYIRDNTNPMEVYTSLEVYRRYRFSKEIVRDKLMSMIIIEDRRNNRGLPIPPLFQILTLLRFYRTSNFQYLDSSHQLPYRTFSNKYLPIIIQEHFFFKSRINQSTISRIITHLSKIMASNAKNYVHFPRNAMNGKLYRINFIKYTKCLELVGALIVLTLKFRTQAVRIRKCIETERAVCGPSMEFMDIVVRWPGSYHD